MIRMPFADKRSFTKRFSLSTQKRCVWRFGKKRRRVAFLACERLLPTVGRLPVTWHTLDIVLNTGKCLRFNDPRRFGAVLFQAPDMQIAMLDNLGPEPLTDDFDDKRLFKLSRNRKGPVKNFIMDNAIVVGVGNIYANEALFLAGIDPRRAAGNISAARYQSLTATIKQVLAKAIEQGGTTLKDFAQTDGKPGYFAQHWNVYGRKGEPCEVCGKAIESKVIGQRNTFFCTHCQR